MIFFNKSNLRRLVSASLFIACTIQAQGQTQEPFVTTWEVATGDLSITIPTGRSGLAINALTYNYNYTVDWGDGTTDTTTYTGDATHTYSAAGTYTVSISGDFPAIFFNNIIPQAGDNSLKIKTIKSWGTQRWLTLHSAFAGCQNLTIEDGAGVPDLTMVTSMSRMFFGATNFDGDLSSWDVSNVNDMGNTFGGATSFNGDLSSWDVSKVTNMVHIFSGASSFNGDVSTWNVSNVTNMGYMFDGAASFDSDLSNWNVSNVTSMWHTFDAATSFNQDISSWNVSNVTNMATTFQNANSFNGDLSSWNVSKVTAMSGAFLGATSFNGDISSWNVSNVTNMGHIFSRASSFNGDLSSWDVSNVTSIWYTFRGATSFNQDLSSWDVSNVIDMDNTFAGATSFNQDLSSWNVSGVRFMSNMFEGATNFSSENYDALLTDWSSLPSLLRNVTFGAPPTTYCDGKTGRGILTGTYNWTITGDLGEDCTATSVDDEFLSNTKIYPNPTNGKVSIESPFEIDKLELYNVLGAKIFSVSKTNTLDLTNLSQGIYILKVFSEDKVVRKKIIKN